MSECYLDSRTFQTKKLIFASPSNHGILPTMVTCLGQPHQFINQFSDIRVRRQASIHIVNQRLVESALVYAVNCCVALRGFSHQYVNCLHARCVVWARAGVASQRTLFLCLFQCPFLRSVYYYDYLAIKIKVSLHVDTCSPQCFI